MDFIIEIYEQIKPYMDMMSALCASFIPVILAVIQALKVKNAKQASEIAEHLKKSTELYDTDLVGRLEGIYDAASREQKVVIDYEKISNNVQELIKAQDEKLMVLAKMLETAFNETSIHPNTKTQLHNMSKQLEFGESTAVITRLTQERDDYKSKYETVISNPPVIEVPVVVESPKDVVEEVSNNKTKRVRH